MKRPGIVAACVLLAACTAVNANEYDPLHTLLGKLPEFKLTDQNGNVVTRDDLTGKVCVISVYFSCCNTMCPITQNNMAGLQDRLAGWPDVLLISINVFPGH